MTDRLPPTVESLERGGIQKFGQEKRRQIAVRNAMTNLNFRCEEICSIIAPDVDKGITNFTLNYRQPLKCSIDRAHCELKIIANGSALVQSSTHEINEMVSVGRRNRILANIEIENNRIKINDLYQFGSFKLNDKNEHVGVLMPHIKLLDLRKSNFLHFELPHQPVIIQFEISIDGGFFMSLVLFPAMLAFVRFDSCSLKTTFAQMFRSVSFDEISEMRQISDIVERYMGQPGLRAQQGRIEKRRNESNQLDDPSTLPPSSTGYPQQSNIQLDQINDGSLMNASPSSTSEPSSTSAIKSSLVDQGSPIDPKLSLNLQCNRGRGRGFPLYQRPVVTNDNPRQLTTLVRRVRGRGVPVHQPFVVSRQPKLCQLPSSLDHKNDNQRSLTFARILNRVRRAVDLSLREISLFAKDEESDD